MSQTLKHRLRIYLKARTKPQCEFLRDLFAATFKVAPGTGRSETDKVAPGTGMCWKPEGLVKVSQGGFSDAATKRPPVMPLCMGGHSGTATQMWYHYDAATHVWPL
eukprot:360384-Chlamydomonas_euryale.AAC.4